MNINSLKESKFLRKEDCGPGILVTITGAKEFNTAMEGQPVDMQWALTFLETPKPFILKSTNGALIASFLGSDDTDQWLGKQIVLYNDPTVQFAGKMMGGIRARAPKIRPQPKMDAPVAVPNPASPFIAHTANPGNYTPVKAQAPIPRAEDMENAEDVPF